MANMPSRDINELHPYVKILCEMFLNECKKAGIDILITQTYRTMEYQQELYNQGRSSKGNIVTNCKPGYSPHNYRLAFDIAIKVNGKVDWNTPLFDKAGVIGEKVGLTWGGRFNSFVDRPHFEWTGGLSIKDLRLGRKPVIPEPILKAGIKCKAVLELQHLLDINMTGVFDNPTDKAVKWFQNSKGLVVDGIVGPKTWKELRK